MTVQSFNARLTHIEEQAAAMQQRVDGYRDQEFAKLFVESGWTQQQLADRLSKRWEKDVSPSWVSNHLRFGRFLIFNTRGIKDFAPEGGFKVRDNLTEKDFREEYWIKQTKAKVPNRGHNAKTAAAKRDEERRFREIIQIMAAEEETVARPKRPIGKALVQAVAGKGWLTHDQIRAALSDVVSGLITNKDIENAATRWNPTPDLPYHIERAQTPSGLKYRVRKLKGPVVDKKTIRKWAPELIPLCDRLIEECKKEAVLRDGVTISQTAFKIKAILQSMGLTPSTAQPEVPEGKAGEPR